MTIIVVIETATDIMTDNMVTGIGKIKTVQTGTITEMTVIDTIIVNRSIS
jgi:hypothetical protein